MIKTLRVDEDIWKYLHTRKLEEHKSIIELLRIELGLVKSSSEDSPDVKD